MKHPIVRPDPADPQDGGEPASYLDRHPVVGTIFHWMMLFLISSLIFSVGGALVFLMIARRWVNMTPRDGWICFAVGGVASLGWFLWIFFRKLRRSVI